MKIFKMIRGFFLKRSRSYKIMQNVIFHVKLLSPTLNERDDYGIPFSKQQYMHGSCLNTKSFDQSGAHESPQVLDIHSVVVL